MKERKVVRVRKSNFFNCSQMKFVAIISPGGLFCMQFFACPIFRVTHLTFRP